ncbi:hypothetical protein Tco_0493468 [Tanacetum coccineum]
MGKLSFYDYHNMVDVFEKTKHNTDFHQIVDFLEASHIRSDRLAAKWKHSLMEEIRFRSQDLEIISIEDKNQDSWLNVKMKEKALLRRLHPNSGWIKGSSIIATASTCVSLAIATASGSFPTAAVFTTVSVATPRVTRSSRGIVIEPSSPISVNIPSISKKDKGKGS